jgi:hypothetical protein
VFSYEILTPAALNFFVSYAEGAVESLWSIDQYFQFVLVLMLSTGLSFQVRGCATGRAVSWVVLCCVRVCVCVCASRRACGVWCCSPARAQWAAPQGRLARSCVLQGCVCSAVCAMRGGHEALHHVTPSPAPQKHAPGPARCPSSKSCWDSWA